MSYAIDLSGKVALVTGASRGLGKAIALGLAGAGADVIVSSRKLDACQQVAREIEAMGRRATAIAAHVGRWDDLDRLADEAYRAFGRVDILVNNAGMSPLAPSSVETSETLFDKVVGVNFKGPFRLTALVGARMAAGDGGSIINISSIGALKPNPSVTPYAGAKAALNAISLAFAQEFAPKVRVNVVSPGGFLTDVAKNWATEDEARAVTALSRWGAPEEIVGTVLYLASAASSYTTGANLRVDGGAFWDRKP
ncbi:MAG: glucose 1-dehydrogenase [Hydrogenophilaceae bacterium]|jgi:NAD(P)-dependent dehydrogenase (short-subunit alcohol dehydrogenase family)|nr:glucose 1-dehydrogenase [Hydrogenophilaceae bacterium]